MSRRVVIVGGGLAGLAAAVGLAESDLDVTLLESRPRLGGRAGSFFDNDSSEWIDTCQHVAMGCCTNLAHFAQLVGVEDLFATQEELLFVGPDGKRCRFRDRPFPAPLHLLGAFWGLSYFSRRDRWRLCRDVAALAHRKWSIDSELSFDEWLTNHSRSAHLRERFWDVILVSALSETADRIAVPHARKVFVDGFLAHREGWRVQIPAVPLDELYGHRVQDWLTERKVNVRSLVGVRQLHLGAGGSVRVGSVELRSGEAIDADEFVVAVPWHRAADLIPEQVVGHESFAGVQRIESAPITSVHLWFDRPVINVPHAVLVGRLSQWVFRRGRDCKLQTANCELEKDGEAQTSHLKSQPSAFNLQPSTLNTQSEYLQVVISASRNIAGWDKASVIDAVMDDLEAVWPQVHEAELLLSRVVTDHRAVFSPVPEVDRLRPPQQSPIGNLQLAGDWTDTGWPATMEGAVKSGFLAAENVLRRAGMPARLVQCGLEPGWLARRLLRL